MRADEVRNRQLRALVKSPISPIAREHGIKSIEIQEYDNFFVKWKTIEIGSVEGTKKAVANMIKKQYPTIPVFSVDNKGEIVGYL